MAAISEHGPDGVAVIIQGKLVGDLITEAGIVVYGIREYVARAESDRRRLMENLLAMRFALWISGIWLIPSALRM